jgi:hypothetical protein
MSGLFRQIPRTLALVLLLNAAVPWGLLADSRSVTVSAHATGPDD